MTVGLICKSVSFTPSIRDAVKFRKLIEIFDDSTVKFMVKCTLFILAINDFNLLSLSSHRKNMLSINLHQKYGLYSDHFLFFSSSSAIKKMLYGGANLVQIAVSRFCLIVFLPNVNILFFNTISTKSLMVSVETNL